MDGAQIVTIVCASISALGTISVAILPIIIANHYKKTDKIDKAHNEELRKERLEDLKSVIKPFQEEVRGQIEEIKSDIAANTVGSVTLLRDRMKSSLDRCKEKGFATDSDKGNWNELYNSYKDLGGNHFKEYVDQWKETMMNLPTEQLIKPTRKRTNLNENRR